MARVTKTDLNEYVEDVINEELDREYALNIKGGGYYALWLMKEPESDEQDEYIVEDQLFKTKGAGTMLKMLRAFMQGVRQGEEQESGQQ